jgi:carbamoyltransferase
MNILGISGTVHDAAAALLQDGKLVAAVEEERFKRVKHIGFAGCIGYETGLPQASIDYCLKTAGIMADQRACSGKDRPVALLSNSKGID